MNQKVVINSGYFDPLHVGHIEYMQLSKNLGDKLVVILNNDVQCELKKGKNFMSQWERKKILEAIKYVDEVFVSIDKDQSVKESIKAISERYKGNKIIFAKGGDRFISEIPEEKVCKELGIELVDGLGKKVQSSSWLINGDKNEYGKKYQNR